VRQQLHRQFLNLIPADRFPHDHRLKPVRPN
jgi:hypothetical protein